MAKKTIKKQERFMVRDIYEQPDVFLGLINKHIKSKKFEVMFEELAKVKKFKKVLFLACGSSYMAGMYGKYTFEELGRIQAECELAHEFLYRDGIIDKGTLVVAISQSGKTGSVLDAVKKVKKKKVKVLGISNNENSELKKLSNYFVHTDAGEEKSLAATKSFTSQLLVIYLLSLYFGSFNKINLKFREQVLKEVLLLPRKMKKVLKLEKEVIKVAKKIYKNDKIVFLGRKYEFIVSNEAVYKFMETTYMKAIGFSAEEFKHGPIAILDKNFPCVVLAPSNGVLKENIKSLKQLKEDGAFVVAVSNLANKSFQDNSNELIKIPKTNETLYPMLLVIVIQLMSYHIASLKGINVDKSRNIQKFIA